MAADFFIGESLVGEGNEVAHIDLIIGIKSGPAGRRSPSAVQPDGRLHHPVGGDDAEPPVQARHGALQQGDDQGRQAGRADVRPGAGRGRARRHRLRRERRDPEGQGRRLLRLRRRVHPLAGQGDKKIFDYNYQATKESIQRALPASRVDEVLAEHEGGAASVRQQRRELIDRAASGAPEWRVRTRTRSLSVATRRLSRCPTERTAR